MDSLIAASGRALAAGDALGALKHVALRDDPPALALRGIAMAQLGEHPRARELLKRAARLTGGLVLRTRTATQIKEILMRISNVIVLLGALALPNFFDKVWAGELQCESTALEECGANSQAGMRECLTKKSRESQAALRRAERQAVAALSKWEEDERFIKLAKAKLIASSKAYEQYRDAQCALAYTLGGGAIGNALELRRLSCLVELNRARTKQLNADLSALPSK